jgi:DNA-binding SARP family transcriptional activator
MISSSSASLRMLGSFQLRVESTVVVLPIHAQKVLGFLALAGPSQSRDTVAGTIWPDSSHERAHSSLRTALWRIRRADESLVRCNRDSVCLDEGVRVDLRDAIYRAHLLLDGSADAATMIDIALFEADLVPDWDEDWIVLQRERLRQLRIHALEATSRALLRQGSHARSIEAAYAALAAEPLRDSAHACLISAHLSEGNRAEARRHYDSYCRLMRDELGLPPSKAVSDLIAPSLV